MLLNNCYSAITFMESASVKRATGNKRTPPPIVQEHDE